MSSELASTTLPGRAGAGFFGVFLVLFCATTIAQAAVNISNKPTKNMSCSAGVCSPTAKGAVLNTTDLANMLQASDVKVTTGSGAITIEITSGLSWASANRLTLDANCNVTIKAPVTVAGPGGLSIVTNDGGTGCDFLFFPGGKVDFWDLSSSLVINGYGYTLANDLRSLARGIGLNPAGFFALSKDIDASGKKYRQSPISAPFAGALEGLGHTVANLLVNDQSMDTNIGLVASSSGRIADLNLPNANVRGGYQSSVGGLVGTNSGFVVGIFVSGIVGKWINSRYVGGLVGTNSGTIDRSAANVTVYGFNFPYSGGLVGSNANGNIYNSYAVATVTADAGYLGGLAGYSSGTVLNCHASGKISGRPSIAGGLIGLADTGATTANSNAVGEVQLADVGNGGGLIGENRGEISKSFAMGNVHSAYGVQYAGGLVGINKGRIDNSYAGGNAQISRGDVGGLIGQNDGTIAETYSTGQVDPVGADDAGGLIGLDQSSGGIADSYWDFDTSGISDPKKGAGWPWNDPGITGLTDAQLKAGLPSGFDPAIWGQNAGINNGYPYLLANTPP